MISNNNNNRFEFCKFLNQKSRSKWQQLCKHLGLMIITLSWYQSFQMWRNKAERKCFAVCARTASSRYFDKDFIVVSFVRISFKIFPGKYVSIFHGRVNFHMCVSNTCKCNNVAYICIANFFFLSPVGLLYS